MPRMMLAATVTAAAVLAVTLQARQEDKVVPVHQEPRHHLMFDSAAVRILDIQIPPGDTTLFHTHSDPILYINMSSSQTRSQILGRDWSGGENTARPGDRTAPVAPVAPIAPAVPGRLNSVTTYPTQPLTHRVNNVGATVFRLIGIINRTAGDERTEPSADFAAKAELENRWFRGYRWLLDSDAIADHRHANPVALVLVRGRAAIAGDKSIALDAPGAFVFLEPGIRHTVKGASGAAGTDADQVVEIEIRRPPA